MTAGDTHSIAYGGRTISFSLNRSWRNTMAIHVKPDMSVEVVAPLDAPEETICETVIWGRQCRIRVIHHIQAGVSLSRGFFTVQTHFPKCPDVTRELVQGTRGRRGKSSSNGSTTVSDDFRTRTTCGRPVSSSASWLAGGDRDAVTDIVTQWVTFCS